MQNVLMYTNIPPEVASLFARGKVRDVYDLGDKLFVIATDRISAFDCIMRNGIPSKGNVLTEMSAFWFDFTGDVVPNHLITMDDREIINLFPKLSIYCDQFEGRSMLVRKATPIKVECVVRGYITGGGWKEYKKNGSICGIQLPPGLIECQRLPETLFTPTSKVDIGHDENMTFEQVCEMIGEDLAHEIRELSLAVYEKTRAYAETRGIIIADTKFEFGRLNGKTILIDEILSPDSSRFWPRAQYKPGGPQPSFDKQFVRDYLETLDWDKTPPAPELPEEIVTKTTEKYQEARDLLLAQ